MHATSPPTGKKFEIHRAKAADLDAGDWKASWLPTFDETLTYKEIEQMVKPFVCGWALGIHSGIIDLEPDWNRQFPDVRFTSVREMLTDAWERAKAGGLV